MTPLLLSLSLAYAQSYGDNVVIDDAIIDSSLIAGGAGAPSGQWDDTNGEYLVAIENPVATPAGATCPLGAFEIYLFEATDVAGPWTQQGAKIGVTANAPCGVRNPGLTVLDNGDWFMVYNVLKNNDSAAYGGVARKVAGVRSRTLASSLDGLWDLHNIHYDGAWFAWGIDEVSGDLMETTSTDHLNWTGHIVSHDLSVWPWSWAQDAYFSPAISCIDGTAFPWDMYILGDDTGDISFGWLIGNETTDDWYVNGAGADYTWTAYTSATWRNLDHLTDSLGFTNIFYEYEDANGDPAIGVTSSDPLTSLDTATVHDRDCVP